MWSFLKFINQSVCISTRLPIVLSIYLTSISLPLSPTPLSHPAPPPAGQRFSVGRVFEMKMDIKPRKNNGVIMSVHGRRDFVLLQLRNGSVELTVDNGKGEIVNRYTPPSPWSICDGKWHTIQGEGGSCLRRGARG